MWSIGIVLLLGFLVQLSIDCRVAEASSDEISFRASVRKDALHGVASCVQAFSQVELHNLVCRRHLMTFVTCHLMLLSCRIYRRAISKDFLACIPHSLLNDDADFVLMTGPLLRAP